MFVRREDKSIVSQKSKSVQNTRARQAVNPKKGIKRIQMKNEFKCSDISFMHNHTLHGTLHHMYVFLSETRIQSEERGSWTRQKLQKDLRKERR